MYLICVVLFQGWIQTFEKGGQNETTVQRRSVHANLGGLGECPQKIRPSEMELREISAWVQQNFYSTVVLESQC